VSAHPSRLWPRIAAALGGVLAPIWLAAAPLGTLRDCAATASPALSGIKELGAACPQLMDALQSLGLDELLYDGWRQRLNRDALGDLTDLTERYGGSKPGSSPDVAALPGILRSLARESTPVAASWWGAFKAWLGRWLAHDSAISERLDRWLERIAQSMTPSNLILYSLVALVLIAALAVIVNELRAAGLLGRGRRERAASQTRRPRSAERTPLAAASQPAALADRLAALLQLLVKRLVQTRRLRSERSLTHRELVARSAFDSETQRAVFAGVASTAESILYGPRRAAPEHVQRVLQDGQTLLAQLSDRSSVR